MAKVQIDLPEEIYEKLKIKAKEHYQSIKGYTTVTLIKLLNGDLQTVAVDTTNLINNPNVDSSTITVKTKVQKPLTPEEIEKQQIKSFQTLAKNILGQELNISEDCSLDPDNRYYEFAEQIDGQYFRWAYTMPLEKQKEFITEWKNYI